MPKTFTLSVPVPFTGAGLRDEAAMTTVIATAVEQALAEINEGARQSGAFSPSLATWEVK